MSDSQAELGRAPTRRQFLKISGVAAAAAAAGAAGLPLFHFRRSARAALTEAGASPTTEKLGSWEDLYRQRWTWDSIAKGSHGWANCRSACAWDLYVKDGIVVREEQSARYEASEAGVPDFNPRGCQKGACYTEVMYGPSRLTVPMKRVGERGSGQWQRISWEQAIEEIAEKMVEHRREARHRHHLPGPGAELRSGRHHRGALQVPDEGGRHLRRQLGRDRRSQHRRHAHSGLCPRGWLQRRVVPLRFPGRLDDEPDGDADL